MLRLDLLVYNMKASTVGRGNLLKLVYKVTPARLGEAIARLQDTFGKTRA